MTLLYLKALRLPILAGTFPGCAIRPWAKAVIQSL